MYITLLLLFLILLYLCTNSTILSLAMSHTEPTLQATNHVPINFESWKEVVSTYKDECFNTLKVCKFVNYIFWYLVLTIINLLTLMFFMKNLFHFEASELIARRYCLLIMGRKYRNGKLNLWNLIFKPYFSREQLISKAPYGVPKDQWSSFVDYHLKPKYQV